ncbi:unnamed protein product, partial [Prorocentrum cordatum]
EEEGSDQTALPGHQLDEEDADVRLLLSRRGEAGAAKGSTVRLFGRDFDVSALEWDAKRAMLAVAAMGGMWALVGLLERLDRRTSIGGETSAQTFRGGRCSTDAAARSGDRHGWIILEGLVRTHPRRGLRSSGIGTFLAAPRHRLRAGKCGPSPG